MTAEPHKVEDAARLAMADLEPTDAALPAKQAIATAPLVVVALAAIVAAFGLAALMLA